MKNQYTVIYGVPCKEIKVLERDKYGARIEYKVKHGRKSHKCWLDYGTILKSKVLTEIVGVKHA